MIDLFPSSRVFIRIGSIDIMWYAVLIVTGAYIAYQISAHNLKKVGYTTNEVDNLFIGVMIFGFIGARLWYVLFFDLQGYLRDPLSIVMMREGGLAIQGGLIAGAAYAYIYTRKHHFDFWQWADLIVPNILIAQALGRWGNFFNQEAYGGIVSKSFIEIFPKFIQDGMYIGGAYHHPTFLYESVANIIGWILIVFVLKRFNRIRRGDLTFAYLMWYGVTRFFIEGLRTDSLMFFNLRIAQIISLIFVLIGILGTFGLFRRNELKPVILLDASLDKASKSLIQDLKKQGYTLGMIANNKEITVKADKDVDIFVSRDDYEKDLPDPEAIFTALTKLGRKRGNSVYVSAETTALEAGQRSGSFTIAYRSDKMPDEALSTVKPNRVVTDLLEIVTLLKEDHEWTTTMM